MVSYNQAGTSAQPKMGFPLSKLVLLLQLSLLALTAYSQDAQPPSYHHHYHHRHHHKHPQPHIPPPTYPPVKPPTHPPVKPPTNPPVKPPVHPPAKPPTRPPTLPPVKPPVYPPVKPPVHPPAKPPTKPPTHPPIKPPVYPPVKPPVHPPVKPPTKPPTLPPLKPPVHPPVKPPAYPPVKPPTLPPAKPPVQPPVKPPTYPPVKPPTPPPAIYIPPPTERPVVVQGYVYCKNCSFIGIDTVNGAKPLTGAKVELRCKTKRFFGNPKPKADITDYNGKFSIEAPKSLNSTTVATKCRVYLVERQPRSLRGPCKRRTNLNGGIKGGLLTPQETFVALPYPLFRAGPFAFEPPKRFCRKH